MGRPRYPVMVASGGFADAGADPSKGACERTSLFPVDGPQLSVKSHPGDHVVHSAYVRYFDGNKNARSHMVLSVYIVLFS